MFAESFGARPEIALLHLGAMVAIAGASWRLARFRHGSASSRSRSPAGKEPRRLAVSPREAPVAFRGWVDAYPPWTSRSSDEVLPGASARTLLTLKGAHPTADVVRDGG